MQQLKLLVEEDLFESKPQFRLSAPMENYRSENSIEIVTRGWSQPSGAHIDSIHAFRSLPASILGALLAAIDAFKYPICLLIGMIRRSRLLM